MTIEVRGVPAHVTADLRQRILRPHETIEQMVLAGDDDPDTGHYAAFEDGDVIGSASVRREAPPWAPEASDSWRLRGMATAEERRNRGVGAAVLAAVVDHVRRRGGGLLWCSARIAAMPFYLRAGFVTRGEAWIEPDIGPHIAMERSI